MQCKISMYVPDASLARTDARASDTSATAPTGTYLVTVFGTLLEPVGGAF